MEIIHQDAKTTLTKLQEAIKCDARSWQSWDLLYIKAEFPFNEWASLPVEAVTELVMQMPSEMRGQVIILPDGNLLCLTKAEHSLALYGWAAEVSKELVRLSPERMLVTYKNINIGQNQEEVVAWFNQNFPKQITPAKEEREMHNHFYGLESMAESFQIAKTKRKFRKPAHVLVVEDDPVTQRIVSNVLKNDFGVIFANNANEAVESYMHNAPDIVFLDINLPDVSGLEVLRAICKQDSEAYVVMFSGNDYPSNIEQALSEGARGFVAKPFRKEQLYHYIQDCQLKQSA